MKYNALFKMKPVVPTPHQKAALGLDPSSCFVLKFSDGLRNCSRPIEVKLSKYFT